jgi:DNA-directed RNA polymerase specialized sigma24 family protein
MTNLALKRNQAVEAAYTTRADFCRIFQHEMKPFYLLAFMLTANHAKAEQCYVAGIADAIDGNPVFREWAHSWSRRLIIKNAIRVLAPVSSHTEPDRDLWYGDGSAAGLTIDAITRLAPLERCVFVMSVLEQYSDVECAALLSCTRQDIARARMRAFQSLATEQAAPQSLSAAAHASEDSVHMVA